MKTELGDEWLLYTPVADSGRERGCSGDRRPLCLKTWRKWTRTVGYHLSERLSDKQNCSASRGSVPTHPLIRPPVFKILYPPVLRCLLFFFSASHLSSFVCRWGVSLVECGRPSSAARRPGLAENWKTCVSLLPPSPPQ